MKTSAQKRSVQYVPNQQRPTRPQSLHYRDIGYLTIQNLCEGIDMANEQGGDKGGWDGQNFELFEVLPVLRS